MRILAVLFVLVGLVGFNIAFANEGVKSCVNTRFLGDHKVIDQNHLVFHNGSKNLLVTTQGCDLRNADRLGLKLTSSFLCTGDLIDLLDDSNFMVGSCVITAMQDQ